MADCKELAIAKLASSGLDLNDAKKLNITFKQDGSKEDGNIPAVPVMVFQYIDPRTGKPFEFAPGWGPYKRYRLLSQPAGFASQTTKKQIRYLQPANSGLAAYFPSNVDWQSILANHNEPIFITEGELKAAKACKEGFVTIGLGGVHSFKSAKSGLLWLPELDSVNWIKRPVFICYDSDFRSNESVCKAVTELAEALAKRGALPHMVALPELDPKTKTGLDDYLVAKSAAEFQLMVESTAQHLTLAAPLFQLNDSFVYIQSPNVVLVQSTDLKITPGAFRDHFLTAETGEQYLLPNGQTSIRPISAAAAWLKWPLRRGADRLTYVPGKPKFIDEHGHTHWNTWSGWGCEPEEGDVQPFLDLLDHLFRGADEAKKWFLQWCAYPIQYPGSKLFTSVLVWGVKHGTGKSLVGYTLGSIYGKNFTELNQKDLYDGFNEWAENKQFVMGDDVTGSDKRHDSDRLKKFITQKELRLNIKHVQSFTVPDCINYYFTANGPTALFLEDDDRRSFVHEVQEGPLDEGFYVDYSLWLDSGGPAALHHYLKQVDVTGFNPAAPAMRTESKERMIADVRSDLGAWVSSLINEPDLVLRVGEIPLSHDLFTNKELLALYDPIGKTGTTANGLGRELRRVGISYVLGGKVIRTKDHADRYYVIRNVKAWQAALLPEVQAHINGAAGRPIKKY